MSDQIISIKKVNNANLSKIIDFLEPFANADMHSFESYNLMFVIPHLILNEDGLGNMHGFVAGTIKACIERHRNDLIAINQHPIEMNSLGSESFKNFVEDINRPGKAFVTLSIPFKDKTVSINFFRFVAQDRWIIVNVWENEVNMLQVAMLNYIRHKQITSDILFHTSMETK